MYLIYSYLLIIFRHEWVSLEKEFKPADVLKLCLDSVVYTGELWTIDRFKMPSHRKKKKKEYTV